MKGLINYKNTASPVKDVDVKKGVITGYLSDFDTKDYDGDIIVKGAYKKSINERNQFFLNQHNWSQPHGRFSVLQEDSKGLYFESEPLINTTYSQDTLKLYEAGIIKEHSVGFITIKDEYSQKDNARIIKEIKLLEGSNVTLGANPNTPFTGFKSLTMEETNDQVKKIVKMLRNGTLTDETFSLLEIALKQLQKQAYNIGVNSLSNKEPLVNNTPLIVEPKSLDIETINNFINTLD
jgi:HK97 family phage prohead protease